MRNTDWQERTWRIATCQYRHVDSSVRAGSGKYNSKWISSFNWFFCFSFWFLHLFGFFICYLLVIRNKRKRGKWINQVESGKRKANSAHNVFPHTLFWFLIQSGPYLINILIYNRFKLLSFHSLLKWFSFRKWNMW